MANIITTSLLSGFRMFAGEALNAWKDQINAAFAGTTAVDAMTVTGAITGASVTTTGNATAAYVDVSTSNALTAVGTNRATALALVSSVNVIASAAASTGVVLPAAATVGIGGKVVIFHNGANAIKVYAAGSDTIDGVAAATGVTLTNALRCEYFVTAALTYISAQLGVVSA